MRETLKQFTTEPLYDAAEALLKKLGIQHTPILKGIPIDQYFEQNDFSYQYIDEVKKCLIHIWHIGYVDDATFEQGSTSSKSNNSSYNSLSIFACEINPNASFPRGMAVDLTRAFNRVSSKSINSNFDMPVVVIMKQGSLLSIATCERSNRSDGGGNKIGKVTLLRNMNCEKLHSGHRQILERIANEVKGALTYDDLYHKWLKSFSIDVLSDEFFKGYKSIYEDIVEYITGKRMVKESNKWVECITGTPCDRIMKEFSQFIDPEKTVRDYVKRLMGRLVFIQFLQKKGWMGVPIGKSWECGDPEFLQNLYDNSAKKDTFVDDVLEPLFNDLNTKRHGDLVTNTNVGTNVKVPYLNGGLFELDEIDQTSFPLPGHFIKKLLDFFASYNFTIDENAPDDVEVAVDPEMLGRIFENLLEDNKDKGTFYTPKEIVQYMCRESLIAYLQTDVKDNGLKEAIRVFVSTYNKEALPPKYIGIIDQRLKDVKICDPAIGSGAFPMGLLKVLFACRKALEGIGDGNASEIKKHIIQNNIYGVDIEKGAVDIARLRFWLSLVVDEETPHALPNMDFKIMQGNSLLEQYRGVDLSDLDYHKTKKKENITQISVFDSEADIYRKQLTSKKEAYFSCEDHARKMELRKEIQELVQKQINALEYDVNLSNLDICGNSQFFLWHTWFSDVFDKGGFDIVIGNPPYVESRSSSIDEEQKNAIQQQIRAIYNADAEYFPRGADLLIFFFGLSINIASKSGINTFITENSWLSTDYGFKFQQFILKKINTLGIIDSDYKYFDSADINTVITFFENQGYRKEKFVPFVHCHGDISIYPYKIHDNSYNNENITVKTFSVNDQILSKYKWGFLFSIDSRLLHLLDYISQKENKSFREKIDIGQGLNLTKNCILSEQIPNSSPYYISDNGPLYRWASSNYFVDNRLISLTRKKPILLLPRGIGTHFCCMNEINGYSASYVEIYEKSILSFEEKLKLWAFCNSSLCWVLREFSGRCNLGGGMLKAEATDLKKIPLCFDFENIEEIRNIYELSRNEKVPTDIDIAVNSSIHRKIDEIVYKYFGVSDGFVTELLLKRFHWRTDKSKNKKK